MKIFKYIKYYLELDEKELSEEALIACQLYYMDKPVRSSKNKYPRVIEYWWRLEDTLAFQRSYKHTRRKLYALDKLNMGKI